MLPTPPDGRVDGPDGRTDTETLLFPGVTTLPIEAPLREEELPEGTMYLPSETPLLREEV